MKQWIKTMLTSVLTISMCLGLTGTIEGASPPTQVEVLLNAKKMNFPDAKPFQDGQGSVMVPIRFVSEALGGKVSYSKSGGKTVVEVEKGDDTVTMTVGQITALVNGKSKNYGPKVILKQNRTFVPLRLVSEGLGEKVEWDKVGRWVWIGSKDIPNSDDPEFKLQPMSKFDAYYKKSTNMHRNMKGELFKGVKLITPKDLPIQLGKGPTIYSVKMDKAHGKDYLAVRGTESGMPIYLLVKNDFVKNRGAILPAFEDHGDGTGTNFHPVVTNSDKFQNSIYRENFDWTTFNLNTADYIAFGSSHMDYIVAMVNPFK